MTKKENSESPRIVEKPRRGRPKKEDSEKRIYVVPVRMTEDEYEAMSKAAKDAGKRTISEWIREKVLS